MQDKPRDQGRGNRAGGGLWAIVVFKGVTALLLWGAFVLLLLAGTREPTDVFSKFVAGLFKGNPPGIVIGFVVSQTESLSSAAALRLAGATALYAQLESVEAIGLGAGKRWAEWLTVLVTASLVPFEVLELTQHPTAVKGATLAINLAVLVYLLKRLVDQRHSRRDKGKLMLGFNVSGAPLARRLEWSPSSPVRPGS